MGLSLAASLAPGPKRVSDRRHASLKTVWKGTRDPSTSLGISAAGSRFAHARKAPQVKPRWADGTARESVWESR